MTTTTHSAFAYNTWRRCTEFYDEELKILKDRLKEIGENVSNKEVLARVNDFEIKLAQQRSNLDWLKRDIQKCARQLREMLESGGGKTENAAIVRHYLQIGKDVNREELATNKLRRDFNRFNASL